MNRRSPSSSYPRMRGRPDDLGIPGARRPGSLAWGLSRLRLGPNLAAPLASTRQRRRPQPEHQHPGVAWNSSAFLLLAGGWPRSAAPSSRPSSGSKGPSSARTRKHARGSGRSPVHPLARVRPQSGAALTPPPTGRPGGHERGRRERGRREPGAAQPIRWQRVAVTAVLAFGIAVAAITVVRRSPTSRLPIWSGAGRDRGEAHLLAWSSPEGTGRSRRQPGRRRRRPPRRRRPHRPRRRRSPFPQRLHRRGLFPAPQPFPRPRPAGRPRPPRGGDAGLVAYLERRRPHPVHPGEFSELSAVGPPKHLGNPELAALPQSDRRTGPGSLALQGPVIAGGWVRKHSRWT